MFALLKRKGRILHEFIKDEEIKDADAIFIAEEALKFVIKCFGSPSDVAIPYKLIRGEVSCFVYNPFKNKFYIILENEIKYPDQYCAVIGLLMYRRVTYGRTGMYSITLIDEAFSYLASIWFLQQKGFKDYANILSNLYLLPSATMTAQEALHIQKHQVSSLKVSNKEAYAGFYDCIVRTALFLEDTIGRKKICQTADAPSWDIWLSRLDNLEAKKVRCYLGLTQEEPQHLHQDMNKTYF